VHSELYFVCVVARDDYWPDAVRHVECSDAGLAIRVFLEYRLVETCIIDTVTTRVCLNAIAV